MKQRKWRMLKQFHLNSYLLLSSVEAVPATFILSEKIINQETSTQLSIVIIQHKNDET